MIQFVYIISQFFSFIVKVNYQHRVLKNFRYLYITICIFTIQSTSYSQESFIKKSGTTIICVVRNDTIWVGADSKIYEQPFISACKIIKMKNFVFAHAGVFEISDSKFAFNADSALYASLGLGKNLRGTMSLFHKASKIWMTWFGGKIAVRKNLPIGVPITGVSMTYLFATYENGQAKVFIYKAQPIVIETKTHEKGITTPIDSQLVIGKQGMTFMIVGGVTEEIKSIAPPGITSDVPATIRKLIGIEIKAHPDKVGKPINIIRVDKGGIHWIDKHQPCK